MLTVQVPDDLAHLYEELARAAGRDQQEYIVDALSAYLEDLEDTRIVTERLRDPQPSLSLQEVKRNLGLDT